MNEIIIPIVIGFTIGVFIVFAYLLPVKLERIGDKLFNIAEELKKIREILEKKD